jgi:hypothetical protein
MDPMLKLETGMQGLALSRHFPEFSDLPSSHTPFESVPAPFISLLHLEDGWCRTRVSIGDLGVLATDRVRGNGLRVDAHDYLHAALAVLGVREGESHWRSDRVQAALWAIRASNLLTSADATQLQRQRDWSLAEVERGGSLQVIERAAQEGPGSSGVVDFAPTSG